jgi:formyltetrahydrofolate-dependent phosphoribosylglycinamide formyltransferase
MDAVRIAVFVSGQGRGSNLQAILDACADGRIPGRVAVVIGTRAGAPALERAVAAGVDTAVVSPRQFAGGEDEYGDALLSVLREHGVDLICLAGYMRLLPKNVVAAFRHRILNIHPALLPFFGGRGMYGHHVHEAVVESGMQVTGCTVHLVDEEYDRGPILLQTVVPVLPDDTAETLAARVLPAEHNTYVEAIRMVAGGEIEVRGRRAVIKKAAGGAASAGPS